ncbi:MAG TPA: T9SS type A sorting domain-containing protein [Haliscomenobacter sp.]|uniref:T9SS type A sorting domain-containing protein n=1 Tax=Haliscomenobacter sp. TaxID=2717303 RepID=UPI002CA3B827|nr:T9SS type A sorting domain-containing protein [Haliscomenobacter sp.]HOY17470.1 T9SS type A sorting domain-containing protein [Haliscomenobacter sp.]
MVAYNYVLKLVVVFLPLLLPGLSFAQKWQNLLTFGGSGNENPGDLHCNAAGDCVLGFTFQRQLELPGRTLSSRGGSDFVVMQRKKGASAYTYLVHGGGPLDEEIIAVRPRNNGGVLCAGVFWRELVLPDTTLTARDAGKAIFVTAHKANGELDWAKIIDGSGLKSASDLVLNENGNIWLSGYFGDTLFVEGEKLIAAGQTDMFLLRLEENGKLQWTRHHGASGNTRAVGIAELPGRAIVGLGYFDQSVRFGETLFTANTTDQDLFLAAWGPDGQLLWTQKGGGVFDVTPVDITTDDKGRIYFCGNIVGVLRFDNGLSVQSKDGNADLFLASCAFNGPPLWARVYSGDQIQECSRLLLAENKIYLSGYTLGNFSWAGSNINPSDGFSSYLGTIDTLGRPMSVSILDADGGLYTGGLAFSPGTQVQLAGVYRGQGVLESLALPAASSYDFFTADFSTLATGIPHVLVDDPAFKVFPTPTSGQVTIYTTEKEPYTVDLIDAFGRQLLQLNGSPQAIDLSTRAPGMYLLQIKRKNRWSTYRIIKE